MAKKIKIDHKAIEDCRCEACARMANEFGERLSPEAKLIANGLGYAVGANLDIIMSQSEGVTFTDMRAAVADGLLPGFHAIVNTVLAEAFFDGKDQPSRQEVLLALRRAIEPKLLHAADQAIEGDTIQRAERDGKTTAPANHTRQ